jgi:glycosyltransferase involved in cell wall biosynthesis
VVTSDLPLSVAIITKNEAGNLPRLLASLEPLGAAEVVIVDSGSTDNTVEIAKTYGARVVETDWPGHVMQKNRALETCTQEWVLSLDADEPISIELAANIRALLTKKELDKNGYEINRRNWFLDDWLYYAWTPEWRFRLVRKGKGHWAGLNPHDRLKIEPPLGRLSGDIHHFSYNSIKELFSRSIDYAQMSAQSLNECGRKFRWHHLIFSPIVRFLQLLVIKRGWMDGWRGLIIAWSSMVTGFLKYAFLYEIEREHKRSQQKNEYY